MTEVTDGEGRSPLAAAGQEGEKCRVCRTALVGRGYARNGIRYCCDKCYFRDRFLGDALRTIESSYLATIEALVAAIDAREHEVGDHSFRVTQFAMILARKKGITGSLLVSIYCGSLLHDIGKIGIPDAILHKEGPLDAQEQAIMRTHPEIGYGIIGRIGYLAQAAQIVLAHHEHFDGTGYPRGLAGHRIPFGARIFSVCDTLDALTVDRPYRQAWSFESALRYVESAAGSRFDPGVVAQMVAAGSELRQYAARVVF